jgi:hypothetical protein
LFPLPLAVTEIVAESKGATSSSGRGGGGGGLGDEATEWAEPG